MLLRFRIMQALSIRVSASPLFTQTKPHFSDSTAEGQLHRDEAGPCLLGQFSKRKIPGSVLFASQPRTKSLQLLVVGTGVGVWAVVGIQE